MKKYLTLVFTLVLPAIFPLLMLFGNQVGEGVRNGLQLAYRSVLPALFPSAVVCGMLAELLEYLPLSPNRALWITAQLCGFPLGIKSVCRAFQRGLIDQKTAVALSACSANASPAFLILYVGGRIFDDLKIGLILFLGQMLISFLIAWCSGALHACPKVYPAEQSLLTIWGNSISGAAFGCLGLIGYICLFSALAAPLKPFGWFDYLYGFLELTGGISELKINHLYLCSAMVGFSGISVLIQNAFLLNQDRLPIKPMVLGKILSALFMPFTLLFLKFNFIISTAVYLIFILFLISFDKYRKTRYNKLNIRTRRRFL